MGESGRAVSKWQTNVRAELRRRVIKPRAPHARDTRGNLRSTALPSLVLYHFRLDIRKFLDAAAVSLKPGLKLEPLAQHCG